MVKPLLIVIVIIVFNDVTNKSREQRLITKEHIRSNAYKLNSSALYSSILVIKLF